MSTGVSVLISGNLFASDHALMSDAEIDERLSYLEQRINDVSSPYAYWQYGWSGLYSVSAISNFSTALDEEDHDEEVLAWVSGLKSSAALAKMLLEPVPLLAEPDMSGFVNDTVEEQRALKLVKLKEYETQLSATALRSDERYQWQTHATTIGVNLIAAAAIATWGDSDDALGSAALGIGMGELAIWTQPTKATQQWQSYQTHFSDIEKENVSWYLVPKLNGLDLVMTF
ncbi:hypothetical protein [Marinomonas sp. PE14-40]|uniref:hypothetical protein n=1 Tax=Marinomonas sp. PE14-40 TaxID=3060621 RepID=UPI003F669F60